MTDQTSEGLDIEEPQLSPAAETSWWAWAILIFGVLSGAVLIGILYLTATNRLRF